MRKIKTLVLTIYLLFAGYTGLGFYGSPLALNKSLCENTILGSLVPWDSGCFYGALFRKENTLGKVKYESAKLDEFMTKGGVSHSVLWYRSFFHQRFGKELETSLDEIESMHWDYTVKDPVKVSAQINFWKFLINEDESKRAQSALDRYCQLFIDPQRGYIVEGIKSVLEEENISLSIDYCAEKVDHK